MYPTSTISDRIVRLGTRSYRQRLEALSGIELTHQKLARLNKDLDDLYELLYERFNTISPSEVVELSPVLNELLKTVKSLHSIYRNTMSSKHLQAEIERLGMNYSALQEIYDDMQNYRLADDKELRELLNQASLLIKQHVS